MNNINPITKTDYPDPDVIRVGDTYYMISTTMYYMPGGVILKSYDLVNWEIESYVFDKLDDPVSGVLGENESYYGKGMWAASLRYHEGKFYVAFVSHGQDCTHLYISNDVKGPWEHKKIEGYFHDCSLLFDDGHVYIVSGNMEIRLCELDSDMTRIKDGGIDKIIIRDDPQKVGLGYEGSHFYKINGKYYVSLIHWPKGGMRTQAVYMSDKVEGPYEGFDVLNDDMGYHGMGVAQGGFVDTPDGEWYAILFQDSGAIGRIPVLVPMVFDESGKPNLGVNGKIPENIDITSTKPGYEYEKLYTSDIFENVNGEYKIKKQWQWNHEPVNSLWNKGNNGELTITTRRLSVNPLWAVNTLTQRMMPKCEAEVNLDGSRLNNGDMAGLIALQGAYAMIGIAKENEKYYLTLIERINAENPFQIGYTDPESAEVTYREEIPNSKIRVGITADFTDMKDTVEFYVIDNGCRKKVGGEHKLRFGIDHFTGARFGLCVFSTKEIGGKVVFDHFEYFCK